MFLKKHAQFIAKYFKIDTNIVSLDELKYGLNVESEHGTKISKLTNITDNDIIITGKIVLAHLIEMPDYYKRLKKMEERGDKYWKNKNKNIFLI